MTAGNNTNKDILGKIARTHELIMMIFFKEKKITRMPFSRRPTTRYKIEIVPHRIISIKSTSKTNLLHSLTFLHLVTFLHLTMTFLQLTFYLFLKVLGDFMTLTFLHLMPLILTLDLDTVMVHPYTKFGVSMSNASKVIAQTNRQTDRQNKNITCPHKRAVTRIKLGKMSFCCLDRGQCSLTVSALFCSITM